MTSISIKELSSLFREVPFCVFVEESCIEISRVILRLEFYQLTRHPIYIDVEDKLEGDKDIFFQLYSIDLDDMITEENKVWKDIYGNYHKGVLMPAMRSMLYSSLSSGESKKEEEKRRKEYKYAETILEYYFHYVNMFPKKSIEIIDGEEYVENKGLHMETEERYRFLNCFLLDKTKNLREEHGLEAVHWMNTFRMENNLPKISREEKISHSKKEDDLAELRRSVARLKFDLQNNPPNIHKLKNR